MNDWIHRGNQLLMKDILAALREKRTPPASGAGRRAKGAETAGIESVARDHEDLERLGLALQLE
jgi:hypothetical protein